jgi:hypothetical protein
VRIAPPVAAEIERTLRGYVNYVLEHELRSAAFLTSEGMRNEG